MRRLLFALILLMGAWPAQAQEPALFPQPVIVDRGYLRLGTAVEFEMEGTTADAFEFVIRVDPTVDVTWNLPATGGSAGTQLQTAGGDNATLSWGAAGSSRDYKVLTGLLSPQDALDAILASPVHRFRYRSDAAISTGDTGTEYAGIVADEAPWAMHFGGTILNPINTAGYTFAAIQALQAEIDALKVQLADRPRRTWRTLWLWATKE